MSLRFKDFISNYRVDYRVVFADVNCSFRLDSSDVAFHLERSNYDLLRSKLGNRYRSISRDTLPLNDSVDCSIVNLSFVTLGSWSLHLTLISATQVGRPSTRNRYVPVVSRALFTPRPIAATVPANSCLIGGPVARSPGIRSRSRLICSRPVRLTIT